MNIWIFNHYAITPDFPGGTRHFDFAKELVKRGHNVTIFASSFNYSLLKEVKKYEKSNFIVEYYEGVRFIWIKTFPYSKNDWRRIINMLSYSFRAYRICKKLNTEKPDVTIGSSVHLFAVYTAYLLAKYYKVPFIMEVRDLWPLTLIEMGVSKFHPFIIILGLLEKYLYKRANGIIVVPPKAKDYIIQFSIPQDRITYIPNGTDLERFNITSESNIRDRKLKLLYVGAMNKANGLENVLLAAKLLRDLPIIVDLVGEGMEKENLTRLKERESINNVNILNGVPKSEVPKILMDADALLHIEMDLPSSQFGGSPNKLFDYLSTGKPIIYASNYVKDYLDSIGCGIYADPNNYEDLALAIKKLLSLSSKERVKMGMNGRKYVEKYHSIPVLVDKLEEVIKEAVANYEKSQA